MRVFVLLVLILLSSPVVAMDYTSFGQLPILHDGRVKPLDSFARHQLHRIYGKQVIQDRSATAWLVQTLMEPSSLFDYPIVRVDNARLRSALKLAPVEQHLYTFDAITDAFAAQQETLLALTQKDVKTLTHFERDYLELYQALDETAQIAQSLLPVLPQPMFTTPAFQKLLNVEDHAPNFLDFLAASKTLTDILLTHPNEPAEDYSPEKKQTVALVFYFEDLARAGRQNTLFRVIVKDETPYHSLWMHVLNAEPNKNWRAPLLEWKALAYAYHNDDADAWDDAIHVLQRDDALLTLEYYYNQLSPALVITLLYAVAFLLLAIPRLPRWPGVAAFYTSAALHTFMILTRIIILERPPVSTLYESVLFVALIAALLGALMDRGKTSHEGKLIASLLGAFLMGISGIFAVGADTLGVVIAVLNTDFWLATHVITITAGYGIALVAGTLAHVYLIKPEDKRYKQLHTIALIALLFTAIGTILGGIWADQSWGRFWGWDPKENGALLIVIWLVWVLHGLITGHLKPIWFACLLAFTNIIVALSWFGVNLLNVGLHSYGFTDSAAYGLLAFCITELVLITSFTLYAKRHAR